MRLFFTLCLLLGVCGCQLLERMETPPSEPSPGTLAGHITIGPLTPVERVGVPTPTIAPQVFAARRILVYRADGRTEVTRIQPDENGDYRVSLAPGDYVVDMVRVGIDRAQGLPAAITIASGVTVTLDIAIDTGIR